MTSLDNKYKVSELYKSKAENSQRGSRFLHFTQLSNEIVYTHSNKLQRKRPIALFIYTLSFSFSGHDASR